MESGGGGCQSAVWLHSIGDAAVHECTGGHKVIDDRSSGSHKEGIVCLWFMLLSSLKDLVALDFLWIRSVHLGLYEGSDIEAETFLRTVQMVCDLIVVIAIISGSGRNFDLLDVCMFCRICRPLHDCTREVNAWDNALKQL